MPAHFDVAIIGLGAMGSAAAYHLARRGRRVLGLDQFTPPHTKGSSHGRTRIIREAYFEHPQYVPIVRHAYTCWARLEAESGERLFEETGGLMIGAPDSRVVSGARTSAELHGLPYEELSAPEVRRRYPALQLSDDMVALLEPRAGMLLPERAVEAHLHLATACGATLQTNETVTSWQAGANEVTIVTTGGRYMAERLIIAAGAWLAGLAPELALPLTVERVVMHWFDPGEQVAQFVPDRLPIFIVEYAPGLMFYGFPARPEGVKVARHHQGEATDAAGVQRDVAPEEVDAMRSLVARFLPGLGDGWLRSCVCLYTNTPDEGFIIDTHPVHSRVLIVSACSGHGFKFSSAIGEIAADLITEGRSAFDLTPFRLSRFG
ncbi:MAG: N-methyl-L-tryptophan oxidase [Luteitalea sp.]|nr:N-methyl-L-tryptophan oxidase [Luteitalea sp.]